MADEWGPRAHRRRAVRLLQGGLAGAHVTGLVALLVWVFLDPGHVVWGVFGFVAVVLFFTAGQAIQVIWSASDPMRLMGYTMIGYFIRVVGLGAAFVALDSLRAPDDRQAVNATATTLIASVIGWVVGEIVVFRRMRIPIYDTEYSAPRDDDEPM